MRDSLTYFLRGGYERRQDVGMVPLQTHLMRGLQPRHELQSSVHEQLRRDVVDGGVIGLTCEHVCEWYGSLEAT